MFLLRKYSQISFLISDLAQNPQQTYQELLVNIRAILSEKYSQKPQVWLWKLSIARNLANTSFKTLILLSSYQAHTRWYVFSWTSIKFILIHDLFIKNSGYEYRLYFLKNSFIIYFHLTFPVVWEDVSVITAILLM